MNEWKVVTIAFLSMIVGFVIGMTRKQPPVVHLGQVVQFCYLQADQKVQCWPQTTKN